MSNDYAGIPAECDVTLARPGEEAGLEVLADGDFALVLTDHDNDTVVTVEGTPAELLAFVRRADQALEHQVDLGDGGRSAGP
ncbi:hypothetical protein H4696_000292 [Amycolatopsis lexingtonensis]|uniref:DUF3117 domain-containing protein n=1 Tax=Amycolatopsis lexingtonensis TaxID=218822 RepID=A0ABR9HR08_9PSEU|nr:hypothetical protein [Amycolatopsis lexingtonensis]MBE1493192.1 hypothetical protein [Amycolatopsis lexingtonensis]